MCYQQPMNLDQAKQLLTNLAPKHHDVLSRSLQQAARHLKGSMSRHEALLMMAEFAWIPPGFMAEKIGDDSVGIDALLAELRITETNPAHAGLRRAAAHLKPMMTLDEAALMLADQAGLRAEFESAAKTVDVPPDRG